MVSEGSESTFYLCVNEALLIHEHRPTLNIQKAAFDTLLASQLRRGCKMKLRVDENTEAASNWFY